MPLTGVNWAARPAIKLVADINDGPGPGPTQHAADAWRELSAALTHADTEFTATMNFAMGNWEGPGAESAREALTPFAEWAAAAESLADRLSAETALQAETFSATKAAMPSMAEVLTTAAVQDAVGGKVVGLLTGVPIPGEVAEVAAAEQQARAALAMATYDAASASITDYVPVQPAPVLTAGVAPSGSSSSASATHNGFGDGYAPNYVSTMAAGVAAFAGAGDGGGAAAPVPGAGGSTHPVGAGGIHPAGAGTAGAGGPGGISPGGIRTTAASIALGAAGSATLGGVSHSVAAAGLGAGGGGAMGAGAFGAGSGRSCGAEGGGRAAMPGAGAGRAFGGGSGTSGAGFGAVSGSGMPGEPSSAATREVSARGPLGAGGASGVGVSTEGTGPRGLGAAGSAVTGGRGGAGTGMGPGGTRGSGQEDQEHEVPDYLKDLEHFSDGRVVAPPVIGADDDAL